MGYLFIDIETFIDKELPESGLNPYLKTSKILSIAYNYYDEFHLTEKKIKNPTILKEWESSEKDILIKFYRFLKMKVEDDNFIKIVGFNQLKFDMSYLFARLIMNKIAEPEETYKMLYQRPHCIDLGQISQILSKNKYKEIFNVNQATANRFFGIPVRKGKGTDYTIYYVNKEYNKYIKAVYDEFVFELLYIHLRRHIYKKKTMVKDEKFKQKGLTDFK